MKKTVLFLLAVVIIGALALAPAILGAAKASQNHHLRLANQHGRNSWQDVAVRRWHDSAHPGANYLWQY